jgi:putative copper resistance protein D
VVTEKKRYRTAFVSIALLVVFGIAGYVALRPGIVRAYPTSFYASTQAYAAPSIARGAPLYAQNCTMCHGASGRGNGPMASKLPVRPADLTEEHLFAHKPGELFWWISYGSDNKVMPGFADKLTPDQRWDLINFVLARAAGLNSRNAGPQLGTTEAYPMPDFAFERNGSQATLSQTLKSGPALVVLYGRPAPRSRLERLAAWRPQFERAGLVVVAVDLDGVSADVRTALALFVSPQNGGETELMLDRGGNIRARWTPRDAGGLADLETLIRDTKLVASIPVAAANHAGHAH